MRIITDSAADFTHEELNRHHISCVYTQVMFGAETFTAEHPLTEDVFWTRLLAGENAKTSQPSPEAFLQAFRAAREAGEDVLCICISSALSGTMQSARIAASMLEDEHIHIVDSMTGAAGQKLLVLAACKLRDEGRLIAREIVQRLENLRSRVRLFASLDTLDNLARSGRIPRAVASLGTLAQLKPLVEVTRDGRIALCGKSLGRRRAIDALAKRIAAMKIDPAHPIIPLYSYQKDNALALLRKLKEHGVSVNEALLSALGPSISPHIGPNAYGVAFVAAE
ncbi:MAG: DegV family protein [Clostridia bacterium]|nr:DegV family protein [Clostridia bacterium]